MSVLVPIQSQSDKQAETFTNGFLKNSLPGMSEKEIGDFMLRKAVVLKYAKKKKEKKKKKRTKGLNAKQRREMKVFQLKPEHQKYELFLPLHELWKQYIRDLCNGLKPESNPQTIQQRLLKADFHGAILTVARSKCPSYVGTTGILVQEMKHVFKIITKEDKLKVIPKRNSVFAVEIDGFVSHIYGSKFELRSSERSAKKFKVKGTIDL
ncbi:ribonuclease P protein subunit p29-like [Coregonus clupeaformis]|uniref:ribonuclease P protein subunit p29-like n=1 Tax=Coregonus clupeaformis TaxID=59861 RepID=UPI001E1C2707|nr:ribonuclease P protein subunit p29-like [Coregonus clupeaformis]XP_045068976.1 ribonuclease P protein subunit p29-like [Coregonus clupeaformis]XP_045068977.1 ribonuclease P protein subunit p29-like [Coregonus clupeaformis]